MSEFRSEFRVYLDNGILEDLNQLAKKHSFTVEEMHEILLKSAIAAYKERGLRKAYVHRYNDLSGVNLTNFSEIRRLRVWAGFTQKEMAFRLGISLSTYVKAEHGTHKLSAKLLKAFAEIINYDYQTLKVLV